MSRRWRWEPEVAVPLVGTARHDVTFQAMRTSLIAALLCTAGLLFANAHAQQDDTLKKQFLEYKANAEKGDAEVIQ